MGDTDDEIDGESSGKPATAPSLVALTPGYTERHHGIYLRHLKEAIEGRDSSAIVNIALTGSYGIGKSSILEKLASDFSDSSVRLSLSTLGDAVAEPNEAQRGTHTSASTTNRIQKEIVKQLLYRESPNRVRDSRFRRIGRFRFWRQLLGSAAVAALFVPVVYVLGLADRFIHFAGATIGPRAWAYLAVFCFLTAVVSGIRYVTHNQILIEKLGAGPATITLSNTAQSYFDEYLDEIVYFFEVSKCNLVIFEDIDRFDEPHIFETLRALNTILNNSKQLNGRRVRFVYAVKDSIFERIEGGQQPATDARRSELTPRANRTKFFDLVIPVVPFITHRNARDLMSQTMTAESGIQKDLIDLAAKHITDMRMIKNIRNEFVVFREKLALDATRLPGLNTDSLFALVLYKNVHLADFEFIKEGTSKLDELYLISRRLVDENLRTLRRERLGTRRRLNRIDSAAARSDGLGTALRAYISQIVRHLNLANVTWDRIQLAYNGAAVSDEELRTADFWRRFTAAEPAVDLIANLPYQPNQLIFNRADLETALGDPLSEAYWRDEDAKAQEAQLTKIDSQRAFLRSADMHDLYQHPEFKLEAGEESLTFEQLTRMHLPTPLAVDLMASGYLNRNFTLYVSEYYGLHVSVDAMNFLVHFVQPDITESHFALSPTDVDSVIQEAGTSALNDRSMYNISILDHLLGNGSADCDRIIDNLTRWEDAEQEFVSAYIADGKHARELFRRLSQAWPKVFAAIETQEVDDDTRLALYDGAFSGASLDVEYEIDSDTRSYLGQQYASLSALSMPTEDATAASTVQNLSRFGIVLPGLRGLDPRIKQGVIEHHAYELTKANIIEALDGQTDLALDVMSRHDIEVYRHVLGDLAEYVEIFGESQATTPYTVASSADFLGIIEDVASESADLVEAIANRSASDCRVDDLTAVSENAWPGLAKSQRITLAFNNVKRYTDVYGIDENLAHALFQAQQVQVSEEDAQAERHDWAVQLLNVPTALIDPRGRVKLVGSLKLDDYIEISDVEPEDGELFSLLVRDDIVEDSSAVLAAMQSLDWTSRERLITVSSNFTTYATAELLDPEDIGPLMQSAVLGKPVKSLALSLLPGIGRQISSSAARAVSEYALDEDELVPVDTLKVIAGAGASPTTIVTLLKAHLNSIGLDDLSGILGSCGDPLAGLAVASGKTVTLPTSPDLPPLLRRLRALGRVRSYRKQRLGGGTNVHLNTDTP